MVDHSCTDWLLEERVYPEPDAPLSLPKFLEFFWKLHPDLQGFACETWEGRFELLCWWYETGSKDYPNRAWNLSCEDETFLFEFPEAWQQGELPRALKQYLVNRQDLQNAYFNGQTHGPERYLLWWAQQGQQHEFSRVTVKAFLKEFNRHSASSAEVPLALPRSIESQYGSQSDLSERFDCSTWEGRFELLCWWYQSGRKSYPSFSWELSDNDLTFLFEFPKDWQQGALPRALQQYLVNREDLRSSYLNGQAYGPERYLLWWAQQGQQQEFPRVTVNAFLKEFNSPSASSAEVPLALPRSIESLYVSQSDLSERFDCSAWEGRFELLCWWYQSGSKNYPDFTWELSDNDLTFLFEFPKAWQQGDLPRALKQYLVNRDDLRSTFFNGQAHGPEKYLLWWAQNGLMEDFPKITSQYFFQELSKFSNVDEISTQLPRYLECLWGSRDDLRAHFDINSESSRFAYLKWWENDGKKQSLSFFAGEISDTLEDDQTLSEFAPQMSSAVDCSNKAKPELSRPSIHGLNIVGFPRGTLGIGEDVRMALSACNASNIPAIAVEPTLAWSPEKTDLSAQDKIRNSLEFNKTLYCLPPPEMVRLALGPRADLITGSKYNIGCWPWELPRWPDSFSNVSLLIDELWAPTRFIKSAFSYIEDKPVHLMPMAVEVKKPEQSHRLKFGLPENKFLYLVMFDGNSWLTRKNPYGAVLAFMEAFKGVSGVGLVIKAMNLRRDSISWQKVENLIRNDERVVVLDKRLSRDDSIELIDCCDAYVSLHRSEGFGRVIAESMLLGKPTIVTNYSGNVDFCTAETSYLVNGDIVPLGKGDYVFWESGAWCEPDNSEAVEQLKAVVDDETRRSEITANAYELMQRKYSVEAVGERYRLRCNEIDRFLN